MPDWLISRATVIGLAVAGGLLSLLASWCQSHGKLPAQQLIWLNRAAYGCMGVSVFLFIVAGFLAAD